MEIKVDIEGNKSLAKRRRTLMTKSKGILKSYHNLTDFKEPVVFMMRRTQRVEFFEGATEGTLMFEHSDGKQRGILLNNKFLQTFTYGKRTFKGYICHEDHALPMPSEPEVTADLVNIAIEKVLHDIQKWKATEWRAKGDFWWKIMIGIAVIIGAYAMYRLLIPEPTGVVEKVIVETIRENVTPVVTNGPTIVG